MDDPLQNDSGLYQTRHFAVFHVEPMPVWKARQGRIRGIECRYEQLGREADHLANKPLEVAGIELCRRIIHK
jgi:hypothetical protein